MTQKYKVYLNRKLIDAVFYADSDTITKEEIKRSLVNHDNYDANIKIVKCHESRRVLDIQLDVINSLEGK